MQLDSVRELKQRVLRSVLAPMLAAAPRALGLAYAASALTATRQTQRLLAVGVSPAGKGQFKLAVRLQRHSLAASAELDRLSDMARGELDVRFIGRVHKRAAPWHQGRNRPLKIGGSVAHFAVTAGTLGGFVRRRGRDEALILSNNHVLANENRAKVGDAVLQPGPYDGGTRGRDRVARLERFVRLKTRGVNLVDSATATLNRGIDYDAAVLTGLGRLKGVAAASVDEGTRVAKVGRTTGVTRGRVTAFELDDVVVAYDIGNASFDDQIEIEGAGSAPFSDGGDSGSLIVDRGGYAVAQLFAGSDTGGRNGRGLTYVTPIQAVLEHLKVELIL
jgi:hypothetical protein